MTDRKQLLIDWRRRLFSAENQSAQRSSLQWIYKMRVRLYRFLLACNGRGDWRADEPSELCSDEVPPVVSPGDTTTNLDAPLQGKLAKTVGKIQKVLKSVTASQDHPAPRGHWGSGVIGADWRIVASSMNRELMWRSATLLKAKQVTARLGQCGRTTLVEVRTKDFDAAIYFLDGFQDAIHGKIDGKKRKFDLDASDMTLITMILVLPATLLVSYVMGSGIPQFLREEAISWQIAALLLIAVIIGGASLAALLAWLLALSIRTAHRAAWREALRRVLGRENEGSQFLIPRSCGRR